MIYATTVNIGKIELDIRYETSTEHNTLHYPTDKTLLADIYVFDAQVSPEDLDELKECFYFENYPLENQELYDLVYNHIIEQIYS